jgi:peptide chain release factor 1
MDLRPHVERFKTRLSEAEAALSDPSVFDNQQKATELSREYGRLKALAAAGDAWLKTVDDLRENREVVQSEPSDSELAQMAKEDIERLEVEEKRLTQEIQWGIIEIRAGAGGSESALFAADLHRMYTRYAETRGWKVESIDASPSDLGGFREVSFLISGHDTFKRFKLESGVHRVQRVPVTEASGRIHTSTATVAVLPEAEEVDVQINPDELEITTCKATGPGGQGVNTTDSAVKILHKPTGMIVSCMDQRSQLKNRERAMKVLRSRLLEKKIAEENAKYAAQRKSQVGTGERNERIRTYNFPQNRITDHRIELTLHNLPTFIEGDIDGMIQPLLDNELNEKLADAGL